MKRANEGKKMADSNFRKLLPLSLTALIIILDQTVKAIIVANWPKPGTFIADIFKNEFLVLYHVRNRAIAFSIGDNIPETFRVVLFVLIPVLVLVFLGWYYIKSAEFSLLQRWAIAGILGGGIGNIIDRIFRKDGVVDFVSVKFYGLFGMQRWPTFNVADASVVICCIILLVTMLIPKKNESKPAKGSKK